MIIPFSSGGLRLADVRARASADATCELDGAGAHSVSECGVRRRRSTVSAPRRERGAGVRDAATLSALFGPARSPLGARRQLFSHSHSSSACLSARMHTHAHGTFSSTTTTTGEHQYAHAPCVRTRHSFINTSIYLVHCAHSHRLSHSRCGYAPRGANTDCKLFNTRAMTLRPAWRVYLASEGGV